MRRVQAVHEVREVQAVRGVLRVHDPSLSWSTGTGNDRASGSVGRVPAPAIPVPRRERLDRGPDLVTERLSGFVLRRVAGLPPGHVVRVTLFLVETESLLCASHHSRPGERPFAAGRTGRSRPGEQRFSPR